MSSGCGPPSGWRSYDSVAQTYERAAVPWFEPLARDLVVAVETRPGDRVLDVGTGTGLTAEVARRAAAPRGVAVGVDPSVAMLEIARAHRGIAAVRAMAPGLPFPDATFDAVVANLVLSHVPDLALALVDMVRVVRPEGRVGVTAWAPHPDDPEDASGAADSVVAAVRSEHGLPSEAPAKGAPWEATLRDRRRIRGALVTAGLVDVEARLHSYRHAFPVADYVAGWGGFGRYLRHAVGASRWQAFVDAAAARLHDRCGDTIVTVRAAWVASGSVTSNRRRC